MLVLRQSICHSKGICSYHASHSCYILYEVSALLYLLTYFIPGFHYIIDAHFCFPKGISVLYFYPSISY
jgi:hypothetical protein